MEAVVQNGIAEELSAVLNDCFVGKKGKWFSCSYRG
jgi:hypothetical protein